MAQVITPRETFPELGTVANPAVLYDGDNVFICYAASVRAGGGNVVLQFAEVIDFHLTPMNVDGITSSRYRIKSYDFNEIIECEEIVKWKVLSPRFWIMSFNDVTIEIMFRSVSYIGRATGDGPQYQTLMYMLGH
jgi:hypothetical protein